ncbi:MAG: trigger factor, partial [Vicinamibacterales bacterium]
MKIELTDISETQKTLAVEIPPDVVEATTVRIAAEYGRSARIPGFRAGKAPAGVVRKRFRERILHDVAHELIPRTVDDALRERGIEPLASPEIRDVTLEEGAPLTFTAAFETVPPIDPGDLATVAIRKPPVVVADEAVERALDRLREQAARYEPATERGVGDDDFLTVDLVRTRLAEGVRQEPERHDNVTVEMGAAANPPGFDAHVRGMLPDTERTFVVTFPSDYEVADLAGAEVEYAVTLKAIRVKHVPALDDEFAKDLGSFESLEALRLRVRQDLEDQAQRDQRADMRQQLLRQLAARVTGETPRVLVEREVDRRVEEFVRRLMEQGVDPMKTSIDWAAFRQEQEAQSVEAVKGTLVLDALARRESIAVAEEDLTAELERFAKASGRSVAAVRARLERDQALGRLAIGVRREKTLDFAMARATIL